MSNLKKKSKKKMVVDLGAMATATVNSKHHISLSRKMNVIPRDS